jgi:hypothetical protein
MSVKFRHRDRFYGGLAVVCTVVLPVAAHAQDAANDRIEVIEHKIQGFESELKRLKGELGEAKQQLRQSPIEAQRDREEARQAREAADQARQHAARAATAEAQATQAAAQAAAAAPPPAVAAAAPAGPGFLGFKVGMPDGRPTIASADGRMSFAIGGLWQFDMGGYFQNLYPNTQFPLLPTGVNLRRGRLYFVAKYDDWKVNVTPDFGDNPDGNPTLFEANINYTGIKPLTFTVGYTHPFASLEDATFPGNLLFLEPGSEDQAIFVTVFAETVESGVQTTAESSPAAAAAEAGAAGRVLCRLLDGADERRIGVAASQRALIDRVIEQMLATGHVRWASSGAPLVRNFPRDFRARAPAARSPSAFQKGVRLSRGRSRGMSMPKPVRSGARGSSPPNRVIRPPPRGLKRCAVAQTSRPPNAIFQRPPRSSSRVGQFPI